VGSKNNFAGAADVETEGSLAAVPWRADVTMHRLS